MRVIQVYIRGHGKNPEVIMGVRKLKPSQYIDEFYPGGSITTQTVRNWIRQNRIKAERTPTGRFLVLVSDEPQQQDNVKKLVSFLES